MAASAKGSLWAAAVSGFVHRDALADTRRPPRADCVEARAAIRAVPAGGQIAEPVEPRRLSSWWLRRAASPRARCSRRSPSRHPVLEVVVSSRSVMLRRGSVTRS